ncbi:hypothetical protein RMATCC62417_11019 [Rhizopus microsporus]|nr:hypothetical protein RMATCC62417_11019 [Rhizopus microsporus]
MSSLHLPSFNNKLKKKPSFILEKRPNLERSVSNSSTLSKVRRFGSKLIRSKSQRIISSPSSPQEASTPFELNISPTFNRDSRSSLVVSLNESTSSIEEHVKTPTTADFCQTSFAFNIEHPNDQEDEQEEDDNDEEVDESTLSTVSLVRYHLSMALKQVDEEIEDELQISHEMMLRNLKSCPRISFK